MVYLKYSKETIRKLLDKADNDSVLIPFEDEEVYFNCPECHEFKEMMYEDLGNAFMGDIKNCLCQECWDKNSYTVPQKYSLIFSQLAENHANIEKIVRDMMDKEHELKEIVNGEKGETI